MRHALLVMILAAAITGCRSAIAPAQLAQAIAEGRQAITLLPGTYRLDDPLALEDVHNLTINAQGVTLVMTRSISALKLHGCTDVTIRGLTIDYDPLPFTQGVITAIDPATGELSFTLHEGYPDLTPTLAVNRSHVFAAADLSWKTGVPDLYGKTTIINTRHGRFRPSKPIPTIAIGDHLCFNFRGSAAIACGKLSEHLVFEDITIHASPGLGIIGRFCLGGDTYRRVRIVPGPPPTGATMPRLFSSCADGLNYAYTRRGPLIEGCEFTRLGDDAINLHTTTLPVFRRLDATSFLTFRPYGNESFPEVCASGDPVRLMSPDTFVIKGETTLAAFEVSEPVDITPELRHQWYPVAKPSGEQRSTFYKVTLAEPLPFAEGDFIDLPAMGCGGFVIRDNYFHDHRARGIRCMASDGLISGNRLERIKQTGISLGPEYAYWREAGWVSNVTVQDNVLLDIGTGGRLTDPTFYAPGAISIFAHVAPLADGSLYPGNHHLQLLRNHIEHCPAVGISIRAATDVQQTDNILIDVDTPRQGH